MNISIFYGTRPELIKLAPIIKLMESDERFNLTIVHTGQHQDLTSDLEFLFAIIPHERFDVMTANQDLNSLLCKIMLSATDYLKRNKPDLVLIQGDTSTVMGVAISCFNLGIKIGHVEAGLRSFNIHEPFPEEFNRKVTSIVSDIHFAPTVLSYNNLLKEDVQEDKIVITGNTVVDAVLMIQSRLNIDIKEEKKILITSHRRENHGQGLVNICYALTELAEMYPEFTFVWPIHPNPNVKGTVCKYLEGVRNIKLLPPLSYADLLREIASSYIIWTDSGGIQEEVATFKKPVLILRNVTERPEIVESGLGTLVGTDTKRLVELTQYFIDNPGQILQMHDKTNPFGKGDAAKQIIESCYDFHKKKSLISVAF